MNKNWKKFSKLTEQCYMQFVTGRNGDNCWKDAFDTLVQAIEAERENNKDFGKEYFQLEDEIEYHYDILGWMEDYLNELEVTQKHEELIHSCEKLIQMFEWKEDSPSDLKFRISVALGEQNKFKEAQEFCERWYEEERDNIVAATATVYARLNLKDMDGAEQIVNQYIQNDTCCTEENDIMFIVAEKLYKLTGNKKAEKKIKKEVEKYEQRLEEEFFGMDDDEDDFGWGDEDFPFL